MLKNVLIFALNGTELVSRANAVAENTVLVTAAGGATGADTVYTFPAEESVVTKLKAIADLALELNPELVLCEASASGRLVSGYLASVLKTSSLPEVQTLEITDSGLESTRMVYGGSFVKTESMPYPAVAVVGPGVLVGDESLKESAVKELSGAMEGIELVDVSVSGSSMGNLAGAKRVVCVGRGLGSADNLPWLTSLLLCWMLKSAAPVPSPRKRTGIPRTATSAFPVSRSRASCTLVWVSPVRCST